MIIEKIITLQVGGGGGVAPLNTTQPFLSYVTALLFCNFFSFVSTSETSYFMHSQYQSG